VFRVVDRRDTRSLRDHTRALDHVRQELERGTPTRSATRTRGVLPARKGGEPWRLPNRSRAPAGVLPR
jgi:hypothetical protein